jgi:hypothetical protein
VVPELVVPLPVVPGAVVPAEVLVPVVEVPEPVVPPVVVPELVVPEAPLPVSPLLVVVLVPDPVVAWVLLTGAVTTPPQPLARASTAAMAGNKTAILIHDFIRSPSNVLGAIAGASGRGGCGIELSLSICAQHHTWTFEQIPESVDLKVMFMPVTNNHRNRVEISPKVIGFKYT